MIATSRQIGVGTFRTSPRMRELVNQVLDSGRISYGPMSRAFEAQFAEIHGCKYGVLSNSGTSSLHVALQALKELYGWQDGDEVIVPALTFVATVNVILHNKMTPVLVDVEPDLYGIDPEKIKAAITPRTRAIMPVHLFGQPCNISEIAAIASYYDLKVIEDSCETMFARHWDISVGEWGHIGCFSMYVAHLLTTGVGGIATTNDPEIAAVMRSLVNHGRDGIYIAIDDDRGLQGAELREVISRRFNFERIGHSFRITELEAALGLAQLETWGDMIRERNQNAKALTYGLKPYADRLQLPSERPHTTQSHMMYPIVMRNETKGRMTAHLEEHGIETRDMLPLVSQPAYRGLWNPNDYPVAKWIDACGFYCGCHQDLTPDDLAYMVDVIWEGLK